MQYTIEIEDVGKEPYVFMVYDANNIRPVRFDLWRDAAECARAIDRLRIDSAYLGATVKELVAT